MYDVIKSLEEKYPVMQKIKNGSIFCVESNSDNKVWIEEGCDGYFGVDLSKEEVLQIACFMKELSDKM